MTRFILAKNYIIPPYSEEWWCCGARGCCRPWGAGNTSACGSSSYQVYSVPHTFQLFIFNIFFASGVGFPLFPEMFSFFYTVILQRIRIIVGDVPDSNLGPLRLTSGALQMSHHISTLKVLNGNMLLPQIQKILYFIEEHILTTVA